MYNISASKNWVNKISGGGILELEAESNLGYNVNYDNGQYGFDTLGVVVPGGGNVSLDKQLIAGIATNDFLVGNLGLADRPREFEGYTPEMGFVSQLQSKNLIPSLSYGYTAGASYRKSQGVKSDVIEH